MSLRLAGTGVALLALTAGNCLFANVIGAPRVEFRRTYALHSNGRVQIQNLYGDVRITAWDRDEVLVEAIKKSADPRQLEDARIVVDSTSDSLSIHTQYGGADAEEPASVEYRITVPRGANLEDVKLVNGGLSISGLVGNVKASSVNGSIHAEHLEGPADLSTINGRLDADFNRVSPARPIMLSSVNGAIHLSLPRCTQADLFARNLAGGIQSEFGQVMRGNGAGTGEHRLRTRLNRGGTQIRVNNVNGGISIRRKVVVAT
jgi:DUF4097 and DUF4098 domain-containing protein YvlB